MTVRKRPRKKLVSGVDPSTGKRRWYSVMVNERTEAQARRMKDFPSLPSPRPVVEVRVTAEDVRNARRKLERGRRSFAEGPVDRVLRRRATRKQEVRAARVRARADVIHAALASGKPVPPRAPVGRLHAIVGSLTEGMFGDDASVEPEALALAQARLAREEEERTLAREKARADQDRIRVAAEAAAAEKNYHLEVKWDETHPERRERWVREWMEETPYTARLKVVESTHTEFETVPDGHGHFARRPVLVSTVVDAPWEPRREDRADAAYDEALRSGEVARWWAPIQQAKEQRDAEWVARMAAKHPDADPSHYGILAQQDAKRAAEERAAADRRDRARSREWAREREEKVRLAETEKAIREKHGIPEGVPVFPPSPEKGPPLITGTEAPKPPTPPPPTGVVMSAVSGNLNTRVFSPINSPINSPLSSPPRAEEPPKVVPKASSYAPSGGAGAVREPPDGSVPSSPPSGLQERRAGRPRLYNFDSSEARWLKSLGFTTAEIVRELDLPDTVSTRAIVRAAVRE